MTSVRSCIVVGCLLLCTSTSAAPPSGSDVWLCAELEPLHQASADAVYRKLVKRGASIDAEDLCHTLAIELGYSSGAGPGGAGPPAMDGGGFSPSRLSKDSISVADTELRTRSAKVPNGPLTTGLQANVDAAKLGSIGGYAKWTDLNPRGSWGYPTYKNELTLAMDAVERRMAPRNSHGDWVIMELDSCAQLLEVAVLAMAEFDAPSVIETDRGDILTVDGNIGPALPLNAEIFVGDLLADGTVGNDCPLGIIDPESLEVWLEEHTI